MAITEFELAIRRQRVWGGWIATALFFAGVGAGLFLVSVFIESRMGATANLGLLIGVLLVGVGSTLSFVMDLGRKDRFWKVMLRPMRSWIARGVILIMAFTILGVLYLTPEAVGSMPWTKTSGIGPVLRVLAVIAAFGVIMYSGFVLSCSPSISFWNTTLLPVLVVFYALMGAIGSIYLLQIAGGIGSANLASLELIDIWLIVSTIVLVFVYLVTMYYSSTAAREATRLLVKGNLALLFLGGVMVIGLVIPLLLTVFAYSAGLDQAASSSILVIGGTLELAGGLMFRFTLLRAGVYSPIY